MTNEQYDLLLKLKRGDKDSPAAKAARLVLVEGVSQADAGRATGASRSTVHLTVRRYEDAHQDILRIYCGAAPAEGH